MGAYTEANYALAGILTELSEYTFQYERVFHSKSVEHRVIIGKTRGTVLHGGQYFVPAATYAFKTAKLANAFLNGFNALNDLRRGCKFGNPNDPIIL